MKKILFISALMLLCGIMYCQTAPVWAWAKGNGSSSTDAGHSIAFDGSGNCYVVGSFTGTLLLGTTTLVSNGFGDIFIAKLDANGNYLWAKQAGGAGLDEAMDVCVDNSSNIYVTGGFMETVAFGATAFASYGSSDIFICKLDSSGNWLWAKQAGSNAPDRGNGIGTDMVGNVYFAGFINSSALFGSTILNTSWSAEAFVSKLDSSGNWLWAISVGGIGNSVCNGISIDNSGNSYVTGNLVGTATFGAISLTSNGTSDIFVAKADTGGNWLWSTKAGGADQETGNDIAIDADGNSYTIGNFSHDIEIGTTAFSSYGLEDAFITKLDNAGSILWAKRIGSPFTDDGYGICADSNGNCYVTGFFQDTVAFGTTSLYCSGENDAYIAMLDTNGSWIWAANAGGASFDTGRSTACDSNGNVYLVGGYNGTVTFGSTSLTSNGGWDIFVAKLSPEEVPVTDDVNPDALSSANWGIAYPNPFRAHVTIGTANLKAEDVTRLTIFNTKGQAVISTVVRGTAQWNWDARDNNGNRVPAGIYFAKAVSGSRSTLVKIMLTQ